jgi:hypothetical protein
VKLVFEPCPFCGIPGPRWHFEDVPKLEVPRRPQEEYESAERANKAIEEQTKRWGSQ